MTDLVPPSNLAKTLGELKNSGWKSQSVKEEIRKNAVVRITAGEELFSGVLGFEETVMPQLENALLAGHDIVFLGERGQAKTRIIRSLIFCSTNGCRLSLEAKSMMTHMRQFHVNHASWLHNMAMPHKFRGYIEACVTEKNLQLQTHQLPT